MNYSKKEYKDKEKSILLSIQTLKEKQALKEIQRESKRTEKHLETCRKNRNNRKKKK